MSRAQPARSQREWTGHNKTVKRWGGKPLPLPRLGPDPGCDDVAGDWGKADTLEAALREAYEAKRRAVARAISKIVGDRRIWDLPPDELAEVQTLNAEFGTLAEAEHKRRTRAGGR